MFNHVFSWLDVCVIFFYLFNWRFLIVFSFLIEIFFCEKYMKKEITFLILQFSHKIFQLVIFSVGKKNN